MYNVIFRLDVDDGRKYGSGHFYRLILVYSQLSKYNCYFLVNDKFYFKKLLKNFKNVKVKKLNIIRYNHDLNLGKKISNLDNTVFIFDTLGRDRLLIKKLRKENSKTKIISLEDRSKNYINSNLTINSKVYFLKKKNIKNIYQGVKYLILKFNKSKKILYLKKSPSYKILVCSGGGDKKNMLFKVSKILLKIKNLEISCIVGIGVEKKNKIFKLSKKNKRLKLINSECNLGNIYKKNDIVITSGGTMMFESLFFLKPTFVIESYSNQKNIIEYLRKKKHIHFLGNIKEINDTFFLIFNNIDSNIKKMNQMIKKSINFIDGNGLKRVLNLINRKILI